MNEQIEKLEHGLMICEATGTELVHIEKTDAEKILVLLKKQEAVEPKEIAYAWRCGKCDEYLTAIENHRIRFCPYCGQKVKWE